MDNTASSMKFVSENLSFSGNLVKDLNHCAYDSLEDFDASDIRDHLTKFLSIKEDEESSDEIKPKSYKDDGSENNHYSQSSNLDTEKCLIKFATFPCSSKSKSPSEFIGRKEERNDDVTADIGVLNDDESSANRLLSHSKSLPTPLKFISAMKGSREKLGTPPKKLSVKWAPDVYDPIPTSVSHVPKNRPRHRSDGKKKGKNKQKNSAKSSRGSKAKDKKQVRKHGSSSNSKRDFPLLDESSTSILVASSEVQTSIVDFDIGSPPAAFCGSSFLKKSVPKLHFAVAEAT
ncbi:PREDICTED: uncharacterized protein LOC109160550 [Ipomoea nil]|uniref:uncharacterized protein LOC109160550 n=1 Tax=Ipomoea nil TaxID=35883 RepID=UPI00090179E9|nr:PREDICTED: uncharacterized protein LOC109160550 [Ipomoea nil]